MTTAGSLLASAALLLLVLLPVPATAQCYWSGCPQGSTCCSNNGECAESLEGCPCRYSGECPRGSCCDTTSPDDNGLGRCTTAPVVDGTQRCPNCNDLNGAQHDGYCCEDGRITSGADECTCSRSSDCVAGTCCRKEAGKDTGTCTDEPFDTDGKQVCRDCTAFNGVDCPDDKGFCCGSGDCVEFPDKCPCKESSQCKSGTCCAKADGEEWGICSTKSSLNGTQVCGDCNRDFNGAQCAPDTTCCPSGQCLKMCPCKNANECRRGECCSFTIQAGKGYCTAIPVSDLEDTPQQICPDCNDFNGASCPTFRPHCCRDGTCAARRSQCPCRSNRQCYTGECCSIPKGSDVGTCSRTLINQQGEQICPSCLDANGLQCPKSKPFCCGDGRCKETQEACGCTDSSDCGAGACCARATDQSEGKCSKSIFDGDVQVCTNCNDAGGLSCPDGMVCCAEGACRASAEECKATQRCSRHADCGSDQCCTEEGTCSATMFDAQGRQVCSDCKSARDYGVSCPTDKPVCCARGGRCAASQAECAPNTVDSQLLRKYQDFHVGFLDLFANSTLGADDALFRSGQWVRPSADDFYDFRPAVVRPVSGTKLSCPDNRWDYSTYQNARGWGLASVAPVLDFAAQHAATQWYLQCAGMERCSKAMEEDDVTLDTIQSWTSAASARLLAFMRRAPNGRSLLCPNRSFWGPLYQLTWRVPDPTQPLFGLHNWVLRSVPRLYDIQYASGRTATVTDLTLLHMALELKYYIPEPILMMEGLVELLIMNDPSLSPDAGASSKSTKDSGDRKPAPERKSSANAANLFTAGVRQPQVLGPRPAHAPGCDSGDIFCSAAAQGLVDIKRGKAGRVQGATAKTVPGQECVDSLNQRNEALQNAVQACSGVKPAADGGYAGPSVAAASLKDILDGDMPGTGQSLTLGKLTINAARAVAGFMCGEDTGRPCDDALTTFLETHSLVLDALESGGQQPQQQPADRRVATKPAVLATRSSPASPSSVGGTRYGDMGCQVPPQASDAYSNAMKCCEGDCGSKPECNLLGAACVPRNLIPMCEAGYQDTYDDVKDKCPLGEAAQQVMSVGPVDAYKAREVADESQRTARDTDLPGLHNGPADAFRHCYWNCRMAQEIGKDQAKEVGDNHEACAPAQFQKPDQTKMDLHNNGVGVGYGNGGANCRSLCYAAAQDGTLQYLEESQWRDPPGRTVQRP